MITEDDKAAVMSTLDSAWIGTGPRAAEFQKLISGYCNSPYAVATNSCTAALHLSLIGAGVQPGDEVIVTPLTFCATANVIVHCGATPVFVDCERATQNINWHKIEQKITRKTKAIICVDMAGRPCDLDEIMEIATRNKVMLIEDAAHALGAEYKGRKVGSIAPLSCFSFYVTKNLTTGEGGMVMTADEELAKKIAIYSLHGLSADAWKRYSDVGFKHYSVQVPGYKYNLTDMQAALGISQFKRIEAMQARRKTIWNIYQEALAGLPIFCPAEPSPDTKHAYHLYTVHLDLDRLVAGRDEIQAALHKENIGTGIHYTAVHNHDYYARTFGYKPSDFPEANWISERTLSLPLAANLSDADVQNVIDAVSKVVNHFAR